MHFAMSAMKIYSLLPVLCRIIIRILDNSVCVYIYTYNLSQKQAIYGVICGSRVVKKTAAFPLLNTVIMVGRIFHHLCLKCFVFRCIFAVICI